MDFQIVSMLVWASQLCLNISSDSKVVIVVVYSAIVTKYIFSKHTGFKMSEKNTVSTEKTHSSTQTQIVKYSTE